MTWRIWALLLLAQAIWAGSYVAMKFAGDAMPVGAVVVYRYGIATLVYLLLLPFVGLPRLEKRDWLLVAVLGALNFALTPSLQVQSLRFTRAADVSILIGLEPVITVVLAALILRERVDRRTFWAMAMGLIGVWILSDPGGTDDASRNRLWGNLLFLTSIFCEVAITLAGGRLAKRYSPVQTIATMKAIGFLTACVFYAPVIAATDPRQFDAQAWWSLVYLGVAASLLAYTAWYWVIARESVNRVAPSLFAQPFIGAGLGWLILDEHLGPRTWIGGTLILGSLAWTQMALRPPKLPAV